MLNYIYSFFYSSENKETVSDDKNLKVQDGDKTEQAQSRKDSLGTETFSLEQDETSNKQIVDMMEEFVIVSDTIPKTEDFPLPQRDSEKKESCLFENVNKIDKITKKERNVVYDSVKYTQSKTDNNFVKSANTHTKKNKRKRKDKHMNSGNNNNNNNNSI